VERFCAVHPDFFIARKENTKTNASRQFLSDGSCRKEGGRYGENDTIQTCPPSFPLAEEA
jgi:hypothetical protein